MENLTKEQINAIANFMRDYEYAHKPKKLSDTQF